MVERSGPSSLPFRRVRSAPGGEISLRKSWASLVTVPERARQCNWIPSEGRRHRAEKAPTRIEKCRSACGQRLCLGDTRRQLAHQRLVVLT
jgi:hypothetical protein